MTHIIQGLKGKLIIFGLAAWSLNSCASQDAYLEQIMKEMEQEKRYQARQDKRIREEVEGIVARVKKEVKEEFEKKRKRNAEQEMERARLAAIAQAAQAEELAKIQARTITTQERQMLREWVQKNAKKYKK